MTTSERRGAWPRVKRWSRSQLAAPATCVLVGGGFVLFAVVNATGSTVGLRHALGYSRGTIADGQWWRLVTVVATDPANWGFDVRSLASPILLWFVGRPVERGIGSVPFVIIYLGCAMVVAAGYLLLRPGFTDYVTGSSGAVFGIYGLLMFGIVAAVLRGDQPFPLLVFVPVSALVLALASAFADLPGDANVGHAAAAALGATIGLLLEFGGAARRTRPGVR